MNGREQATRLELCTIHQIGHGERHGTARDLFTVWFGTNIQLLTIVTGGLAVSAFHLPLLWAIIGLTLGNLVGAIFMALHAAQGPRLGVPQMVQTRGQFGSYGSLLVICIVIIMYVGFLASNMVLGGEALASLASGWGDGPGIILIAIFSVVATIYGHDLIHAYARIVTYVAGLVLVLSFVWIIWVHGVPADFLTRNAFNLSGFLGTVSVAAIWQISYAPYVSDYSRYMPYETGAKPAFWASYWGCTLGSLLPMILGAMVALAAPIGSLVHGLAVLTSGISPLVLIVFSIAIAVSSAMNLYCGALSTLTVGQTLFSSWLPGPRARTIATVTLISVAVSVAFLSKDSFLANYEGFVLLLLYVLIPWTAINLVDYYLLRRGEYDVAAFFREDGGIYGLINAPAVVCYVLGTAIQIPFVATQLYTGPIARAMGGIDLSWIVGLLVTSPAYYWLARRSPAHQAGSIGATAEVNAAP